MNGRSRSLMILLNLLAQQQWGAGSSQDLWFRETVCADPRESYGHGPKTLQQRLKGSGVNGRLNWNFRRCLRLFCGRLGAQCKDLAATLAGARRRTLGLAGATDGPY